MSRMCSGRITLEAATADEARTGGAGWTLTAGFAESPFGRILAAEGPRGICHLSFVETRAPDADWAALQAEWPGARLQRDDACAARLVARAFAPPEPAPRVPPPLRVVVRGTAFQVRVWRSLLRIERGALVSYGRLAALLGCPAAARAVGRAVGRNPVAVLIPCHRVVRETGEPGGYRWGVARKRAILAWESSPPAASGSRR